LGIILAAFAPSSATRLGAVDMIDTIAFGSCAHQDEEQPIWDAIRAAEPDLFAFLGDNVYGDTDDMATLQAQYAKLGAKPGYRQLLASGTRVVATWDDHDYGRDNAGAEYPWKHESKRIFLDFFGEPEDSERRARDGGIYTAYELGPIERRVQVILLDLRWDRSQPRRLPQELFEARWAVDRSGPYLPTVGRGARMLGEDQWRWLEARLREPAAVRIIGTSLAFLQATGWEDWAMFPDERERLIDLIASTGASGVVLVSGDTHRAQLSRRDVDVPYAIWEVNASGLTRNYGHVPLDPLRVGDIYADDNFGLIRIDWGTPEPNLSLEIRDVDGRVVMQRTVGLSQLSAARLAGVGDDALLAPLGATTRSR
jgi:alkaline phosphatase D